MSMLCISVLLLLLLLNNGFAEKLKFQRGTTEEFSYSLTSSKAKLTVGLMTCFSSAPRSAAVTLVKPTDATLQHKFKAKVLQIFSDSISIELERVDVHTSWEWMELRIDWIVYLEDANSEWFEASNGLLYKYIPIRMRYDNAKVECEKLGAWVVVYAATNKAVLTQMHNEVIPTIQLGYYWIGLTRVDADQDWVWEDGTPLGENTRWAAFEPNNFLSGHEFCVIGGYSLGGGISTRWADVNCNTLQAVLCERPK